MTVKLMKNGFLVIPFILPNNNNNNNNKNNKNTTHYIYIKEHTQSSSKEEESACLFVINLPLLSHLEIVKKNFNKIFQLYNTQAIMETLLYDDEFKVKEIDLNFLTSDLDNGPDKNLTRFLPHNTCLLKFIDQENLDNAFTSLKKYSNDSNLKKKNTKMHTLQKWDGIPSPSIKDFINFYKPLDVEYLKKDINENMKYFEMKEQEAMEKLDQASSIVDEDGFTLVVGKNTKNLNSIRRRIMNKNPLTKYETMAGNKIVKKNTTSNNKKDKVKLDFYRFQVRERKKQEINELLKKFKQDQEKIKEMKTQRRFNPYR
ncbi:related to Ribosomal RNA-processing protein 7 [Saccharomycodes ludwigii]|uniref:Related to Ribosomal RNA-processing protein 7 n=1 Tax=Saccharomycodes ludwigii TaxID=36035 RepID=A0A376B6J5_9ASCO|nr:hypothetical protein SCDLUD_003851 [Saccharomycodes ludwigii]KAH3899571.1 hypothetical protein SCDLUD_003851 [Saccharomycodes ludwigii]SSD60327.1 related to Ribosomal RNA-processing protein 7 [Saccharomycodes ludwigii]